MKTSKQGYLANDISKNIISVKVTVHRWSGKSNRRDLAQDIADKVGGDEAQFTTAIRMLPPNVKHDIGTAASRIRRCFKRHTLPWEDGGWRILKAENFAKFKDELEVLRLEYQQVVDDMVRNRDSHFKYAKQSLGKAFDPDKFPSASEMESRFAVSLRSRGVASPRLIQVQGLSNEDEAELKRSMEAELTEQVSGAVENIVIQLQKLLENTIKKLGRESQKGVQYKALKARAKEICASLGELNITDDKEINKLIAKVEGTITSIDQDSVREVKRERTKKTKETKEVMEALSNFGVKKK
jgi:hypothetical protein